MIRTFYLDRPTDVTGVSGTGLVAHGVVFDDGTTVIRWLGEHQSTVVWSSLEDAVEIHGHHGTTFVWDDPAPHHRPGAIETADAIDQAAEIIATRWHLNAAEGKRATPEEFANDFAEDLARAGLLTAPKEGTDDR
jgi:hypothetical protein